MRDPPTKEHQCLADYGGKTWRIESPTVKENLALKRQKNKFMLESIELYKDISTAKYLTNDGTTQTFIYDIK